MIQVHNIQKSFGEKAVLRGISFEIPKKTTTCIIGRSGSGKSVLMKIIVGLLPADSGEVTIDGKKLGDLSEAELYQLRRKFGFVFQWAALFDSLTVLENIVLGLYYHGIRDEKYLEQEAQRVLEAVGLLPQRKDVGEKEFFREYTLLRDKKPAELSGGMRKRVGIARALMGNPEYIFYDEPTTGLDPVTSEQIDRLIEELNHKLDVTSIVITHDIFSVYNVGDHVILLHDGLVRFSGTPQQLTLSSDPVVQEFLERYEEGAHHLLQAEKEK